MNERNSSDKPKYRVTSEDLDKWVDRTGRSYDDAYRNFGITSPEQVDFSNDPDFISAQETTKASEQATDSVDDTVATLKDVEQGPSLSLVGRARALDTIMSQFSQENKTQGAHASRDYNEIDRRYERPDEVLGNMRSKSSRMGREAVKALDVLAEGDSGVPMPADADYAGAIESDLRKKFGPGVAYSGDRDKMLRRAYKSAGLKKPK